MARNVSDEELHLKKRARRRLVGAIVLVTAVAVVLPMILDSEPKPSSQSINIQIPSPDSGVLTSRPLPLKTPEPQAAQTVPRTETKADAAVQAKSAPAKPATAEQQKGESGTAVRSGASSDAATAAKPVSKSPDGVPVQPKAPPKPAIAESGKPAAPAPKPDAPVSGGFAIQVVALADAEKAKVLQKQIAGSGLPAYTEVVQTAKGPVTRVRVGPFASREAAEQGVGQLKKLELDGKVVPR